MFYFDHAATTPLSPSVKKAMLPWLEEASGYGNPSSLHQAGRLARQTVEEARAQIARHLGAQSDEIFFTSGGTEANNWAVRGLADMRETQKPNSRHHLITTQVEHPSVLNPCQHLKTLGWEVTQLSVNAEGFVSLDELEAALQPNTALVSVIHGHNEIGTLQPIEACGTLLRKKNILFHTDAVQTLGKVPIDLNTLPVDYLSFSGHKFYGPKGIGGLFIRKSAPRPVPLLWGGGQEASLRSGTENVAGIVGMAKAVQLACQEMGEESQRLRELQIYLIQQLGTALKGTAVQWHLNGPKDLSRRVPGNIHISLTCENGVIIEGESLVLQLDLKGICASSGSACHSATIEPSKTILSLGKSRAEATSTLRLSFGHRTTTEAIDKFLETLPQIINRLARSPSSFNSRSI